MWGLDVDLPGDGDGDMRIPAAIGGSYYAMRVRRRRVSGLRVWTGEGNAPLRVSS